MYEQHSTTEESSGASILAFSKATFWLPPWHGFQLQLMALVHHGDGFVPDISFDALQIFHITLELTMQLA